MNSFQQCLAQRGGAGGERLRTGIVYSIVWLAGFGSSYALYQGLRARRMIKLNPGLEGNGRAWWCIIAGGLGVAVLCTIAGIGIFNAMT